MSFIRSPQSGESRLYLCIQCGRTFEAKVPRSMFFVKPASPACPQCGSRKTVPHPAVRY